MADFAVGFRMHAYTKDLDRNVVSKILMGAEGDPSIERKYENFDEGIAGIWFRDSPDFQNMDNRVAWQRPAIRNLVQWLKTKSSEEIGNLIMSGSKVDVFLVSYFGLLPRQLLTEVIRLNLDLYIMK